MTSVRESISRIKSITKSNDPQSFVTDRLVYSLLNKHSARLIETYRVKFNISDDDIYTSISCLDMEKISRIDDCCLPIQDCSVKEWWRSKKKLPEIRTLYGKYLIRGVYSIDRSRSFDQITFKKYQALLETTTYHFTRKNYFIIDSGYLYIPDVEVRKVIVEAAFIDTVEAFAIGCECNKDYCYDPRDSKLTIPSQLLAEAEASVVQELMGMYNIPPDFNDDNKHIAK